MSRAPFLVETFIQENLNEWIRLLGVKWRVTFEIVEQPIGGDPRTAAQSSYGKGDDGRTETHIVFYRALVGNARDAEETVIHEILHTYDFGLGMPPALHRFIARLERPLRMVRKRAAA